MNSEYYQKYRKKKRQEDPLFWKSHQLRSNWRARSKQYEGSTALPTAKEIRDWLLNQQPWKCHYTGEEISFETLGLDHKVPISRGGTYDLSNLVITSKKINGAKGGMTDKEFRQLLKLISKWEDKGQAILSRLKAAGHIFSRRS